jgi:hypothetical protein
MESFQLIVSALLSSNILSLVETSVTFSSLSANIANVISIDVLPMDTIGSNVITSNSADIL